MEHASTKINAADNTTDIPKIAFSDAVKFLKGQVPVTKSEWDKLEPKVRFRAFTVSRLSECSYIEAVKGLLIDSIENGTRFAETWKNAKAWADADQTENFLPGYWENVYRTNMETAYTAGKLMQYDKTNPVAYQLFVIEDSRTSTICRHLLTESGHGMILAVDHPFWKTYGFPPYHYQCRTSFRAIYASQIGKDGINTDNPSMKSLAKFKPLDGFGGNPLDNGNWWMMLPSQAMQAMKFGILGEFNREENIFADYDSLWKGYTRTEGKNGGWFDLCDNPPNDWKTANKPVVEKLSNFGYKIKVIPAIENVQTHYKISWSNPDIILNGTLSDIKTPEKMTSNAIKGRIKSAYEQGLSHVVLNIPDAMPNDELMRSFLRWKGEKHNRKMSVLLLYKGNISTEII
jgi:SPP1 gp7 family putative phage head morphogenesis protein